jgi:excisionase family DNA binding protein
MTKRFEPIDHNRDIPSPVMTVDEVATLLRCAPSTIYRMLKRKELPCWRMGSDWRFDQRKIEEWMKRQTLAALVVR